MKFLLFADLHVDPRWPVSTNRELHIMQQRAEAEGCDFIIHAGDLCFGAGNIKEFVEEYNSFHIPSYHVLGNHDADRTPRDEVLALYRMPHNYYYFDCEGYRIIALDPNYYYLEGAYYPYDMGNYYKHGEYRDWVPPEQLLWLEETIRTSPYPCLIISHESFEREADGVKNQMEVRRILNEANRRKPGSVLMCMNGHYHRDFIRILDNICYLDVNSGVGEYVGIKHHCYSDAEHDACPALAHLVCYDPLPVYYVVTVEGTTIQIDGMQGGLLHGITREMTGNPPFDPAGRDTTGNAQSAKFKLW